MSSERPRWYRRRLVIVLGALVAVLACAAAVFALTRPGDVFNPDVEFLAEETPTTVPTPAPEPPVSKSRGGKKRKVRPLAGFQWPVYGYTNDRRRYLPAEWKVRPPYKKLWGRKFGVLLEFPPIIVGNRLYTVGNAGKVVCFDRTTGKKVWARDLGYLAASSPAYGRRLIFVTILERSKGVRAGRVVALGARRGRIQWQRDLPSRSESSPLYVGNRVYFGAENGTLYSLRAGNGATEWTFRAAGAIKGGPALEDGRLYFGTYGGNVYAVNRKSGKQAWRTGTSGANFGLSAGNFYATPSVAFGRVYIGNTDGNMYSFSAATGKLAWRRGTGSYVYSSAAVAQPRDGEPTVFFGSYDGTFYALDARTGKTRWTYEDGGKISGGASLIGDIVYYSNWGERDTKGLWAKSGELAWYNEAGAFNPVVSDGQAIYLTGFSSIGAWLPKTAAEERATRERRAKKAAKERAARKRRAAAAKSRATAKRRAAAAKRRAAAAKRRAAAKKRRAAAAKRRAAAAKRRAAAKKRRAAAAKRRAAAAKRRARRRAAQREQRGGD
jgi:outer membrane protein assembly factor BamB